MEERSLLLGMITIITDDIVELIVQLNPFEEAELFDEVRKFPINPFKGAVKLEINNIVEIETITGVGFVTIKFKDASEENAIIYKKRYDTAHEKFIKRLGKLKNFNNKQF